MKRICIGVLTCSLLSGVSAFPAMAQTVDEADGRRLDKIVVTAQRREEDLQDVPISVTAVSGERLENEGIDELLDLSAYTPGLSISEGPINTNIFIRGIGSGLNRSFEQSVGLYIDGIYNGRGRQYRSPFLDIERVEVLRGPQGTLFGKNTVAGAINIATRSNRPGDDPEAELSASFEPRFGLFSVTGAVGGGGERSAARIAMKYRESDGYIFNGTENRDEPALKEITLRGTFVYEFADNLDLNVKVGYSDYEVTGNNAVPRVFRLIDDPAAGLDTAGFALVANGLADPNFVGGGNFQTFRNSGGPGGSISPFFSDFGRVPEQNFTEVFNASGTFNWDVGIGTITSVTGYSEYSTEDAIDSDLLPIQLIITDDFHDFDQFSQELRFTSETGGFLDYIVGFYYDRSDLSINNSSLIDGTIGGLASVLTMGTADTLFGPALGFPFSFNVINRVGDFEQVSKTTAVFGEATANLTDRLALTGGVRWSRDTKTVEKSLFLGSDTTGGTFTPVDPNVFPDGAILTAAWSALFGTLPHELSDRRTENNVTPSAKITYDVADDILLYGSFSKGFKSGGFNSSPDLPFAGAATFPAPYDQGTALGFEYDSESATAYEIGVKSEFLDGAARLNVAAFFTDYEDLQVSTFQGTNFIVGNAAAAEIWGVEVDGEWMLTDWLRVGGSVGYLNFEYTDFPTAGCTSEQAALINTEFASGGDGGPGSLTSGLCSAVRDASGAAQIGVNGFPNLNQDLSGQVANFAPKWSGNTYAAVEVPLTANLVASGTVNMNFSSSHFLDSDLDPASLQDAYQRFNVRIAIGDADGRWEVAAFGRNLTDEEVFVASVDTPLITGSHTAFVEEPRVWGGQITLRY